MRTSVLVFLLAILCNSVMGQTNDTLFAIRKGNNWAIKYTVQPREHTHMLATRFFLSDRALENANEMDGGRKIIPGAIIEVPVVAENYFSNKPSIENPNFRELYYHVGSKDDIGIISTYAGVSKADMRKWNGLKGNTLSAGQVLFVGWVKVLALDSLNPSTQDAYPPVRSESSKEMVKQAVPGKLDSVFNVQTNNGMNVLTEKGTAVFFEKAGKSTIYVGFHNATPRGNIIKVFNPGNGKTIYVKIIGPLPNTKQYANSIIGISSAAKEALGVTDSKAWCELSYAAN